MEKIYKILHNNDFRDLYIRLSKLEEQRSFCKHDMDHFISVARIAYIKCLENKIPCKKHIIYAAALLHDMGRVMQYEEGIPHHIAGVKVANNILSQCDFTKEEIKEVCTLIESHREKTNSNDLQGFFTMADKLSRNCFICEAIEQCNWDKNKMNFNITV